MERTFLSRKIRVCKEDGAEMREYRICAKTSPQGRSSTARKIIGEGASAIAYEAYCENDEYQWKGVLKEFYPSENIDAYERNKDGQLIIAEDRVDPEKYLELEMKKEKYIRTHKNLSILANDENIRSFIPDPEILYGCDNDGNIIGTVYIWTPHPEVVKFEDVCSEIWKNLSEPDPNQSIGKILKAIENLTECIRALHANGFVHGDINPSNFGFGKRNGKILPEQIQLFDLNTIRMVEDETGVKTGTAGYTEPENQADDNQSDIYAIGATLYKAITNQQYVFGQERDINQLLADSELLKSVANPELNHALSKVLAGCLSERENRYENCEELLKDLEEAIQSILPKKKWNGEWVWKDTFDINKAYQAIQYHLYEHPIYKECTAKQNVLTVLAVGFGNYLQKFLDYSLQLGQMRNKQLKVIAVTDEKTKEQYLKERPQLGEFFAIDKKAQTDDYGELDFDIQKINYRHPEQAEELVMNALDQLDLADNPPYTFVALGDDNVSRRVAENIADFGSNFYARYIYEGNPDERVDKERVYAIPVYGYKEQPEIERMAYNAHLIWEKDLLDYQNTRKEFSKGYNHESCISNVLSIKYKLYSIHIDMDEEGTTGAAKKFADRYESTIPGKEIKINQEKNELIWIEHKRWVTEKLCQGWTRMESLGTEDGDTKDKKNKKHICIVKSRPDQKLADNDIYWDKESANGQIQRELDELDYLSVRLHKKYTKKRDQIKKKQDLSGNLTRIEELVATDRYACAAFHDWSSCIKDIWNRDIEGASPDENRNKAKAYGKSRDNFRKAIKDHKQKEEINKKLVEFDKDFLPFVKSLEYEDYKKKDMDLVSGIPFILTYTEHAYMVIPYMTGNNSNVFENVAAPTIVNPERILYIYNIGSNKNKEGDKLINSLPKVMRYMQAKHLRAAVEFIITCDPSIDKKEYESKLKNIGKTRIRQIYFLPYEKTFESLKAYLKKREKGKKFFAVEDKENIGGKISEAFCSYQFNIGKQEFEEADNSPMLQYIRVKPYLTVAEVFAFCGATCNSSFRSALYKNDQELWELYRKDKNTWKNMCSDLQKKIDTNDRIQSFQRNKSEKNNPDTYQYYLPHDCLESVNKIIDQLEEYKILEKGRSSIKNSTAEDIQVVISDIYGYKNEFDTLFLYRDPSWLRTAQYITVKERIDDRYGYVDVVYDNLQVCKITIPSNQRNLYKELEDMKMILGMEKVSSGDGHENSELFTFRFRNRSVKELLTKEGTILEIYTYHQAQKDGNFDDVVCSYEINWENENIKNEFDCVMTKGFQVLFVEAKARATLEQDFYHKISSLRDKFGFNVKAVMVADARRDSDINDMQIERGREMGIETIIMNELQRKRLGEELAGILNS